MDLDDFAAVRAVVRHGTFSAAADALHVSQPALSRRVARIEDELGGKLFDRGARHAAPTALGRALAEAGQRVEAERDRALEEASDVVAGRSGTIRIASLAGGIPVLARGLARFQEMHPRVWVELRTLGPDDAVDALRSREVDLATLPGSAVAPDMRSRKLARWKPVVVVRPDHRFAAVSSIPIGDLADEPVLMLAPEFMVARHVMDMAARGGVRLRPRLLDGTPEAVLALARRGWGAGVVPDSVRLPAGVVAVPIAGRTSSREFDYVVAWLSGRTQSPSAARLVWVLARETAAFR
jgi:DNA-binding transcriptional LysR family regulator